MVESVAGEPCSLTDDNRAKGSARSRKWAYVVAISGVVMTLAMIAAIVYYANDIAQLKHYGYLGAFVISVLGGATIIIPVPMLAVVLALGGVMASPWNAALLALSAASGELIGALTIYVTGHGAGRAIVDGRYGRIQSAYERMLDLMERRGSIVLFAMASVINPFFYPAALACGALHFGLKKYTLIVFAGKTIKCMTVVYAGYFGLKGLFRIFGVNV